MKINKFYKDIALLGATTLLLMVGVNVVSANNDKDIDTSINNTIISEVKSTQLTKEEALEEILNFNSKVDFEYLGTEKEFDALQEKGLEGYVFLPNVDTDLAYFIDKNTKELYYFHPSGWMELIDTK